MDQYIIINNIISVVRTQLQQERRAEHFLDHILIALLDHLALLLSTLVQLQVFH